MIRKIFILLILSIITSSNAFAERCGSFIEMNWKYVDYPQTTHVRDENAYYAKFFFKSSSEKPIKIHKIFLYTSDNRTVSSKSLDAMIKPFGKGSGSIWVRDLNLDVVSAGTYSCSFVKAATQSNTSSNSTNRTSNYSPSTKSDSSGLMIFLILILAIIAIIFLIRHDSDADKKPKKKLKLKISEEVKDKTFYSNQYGWSFPGKYVLLAIPAVGGLIYFEHGFAKFIFGVYLLGCVIGFFRGDR